MSPKCYSAEFSCFFKAYLLKFNVLLNLLELVGLWELFCRSIIFWLCFFLWWWWCPLHPVLPLCSSNCSRISVLNSSKSVSNLCLKSFFYYMTSNLFCQELFLGYLLFNSVLISFILLIYEVYYCNLSSCLWFSN